VWDTSDLVGDRCLFVLRSVPRGTGLEGLRKPEREELERHGGWMF
jgi:hypothetical protein